MINNNTKIGFDAQNRAIVAYHKYDAAGNTQLYNARFEGGRWVVPPDVDWTYRWVVRRHRHAGVPDRGRGGQAAARRHADAGVVPRAVRRLGRVPPRPDHAARHRDDLRRRSPTRARWRRCSRRRPGMVVRWARTPAPAPTRACSTCCAGRRCESNRDMPPATDPAADAPAALRLPVVAPSGLRLRNTVQRRCATARNGTCMSSRTRAFCWKGRLGRR